MKKNILRIISLLSMIFFFFPFFTIVWDYKNTTYSGLDLATGHDMSPYSTGFPFVFLLLLIPIVFLAISFYSKKRERITALIASTAGVFTLLVISIIAALVSEKQGFDLTTKSGFFLYLLVTVSSIFYILYEFVLENPILESPPTHINNGSLAKIKNLLPIFDIEERMLQLSKIKNLYENKILSTEEFHIKKSIWIGSLKYYSFESIEMDLLSELLPYVTECIISPEELIKIKYLISQEYVDVRSKAASDEKQSEVDLARTKRLEITSMLKAKAKEGLNSIKYGFNNTVSSIEKKVQGPLCECGKPLHNGSVFCKSCGKKAGSKPAVATPLRCSCGESIDSSLVFCTNCGKSTR